MTTWDWDDGQRDEAPFEPARGSHARRSHRYSAVGVYRVRVGVGSASGHRYVTVRGPGQIAASGWIRARPGLAVAFGFLITPRTEPTDDAIIARFLLGDEELTSTRMSWILAAEPRSLHFGGTANLGSGFGYPYRVDVAPTSSSAHRQHLSLSIYDPRSIPGHDSPIRRIAGAVRPGRVELRPLARTEPRGAVRLR